MMRGNNWHKYNAAKLGKPVDRTEWGITPQTYNAYYNPSNNEIVLPAGIFTAIPGFKDEILMMRLFMAMLLPQPSVTK
jgi:putative endopeptidase